MDLWFITLLALINATDGFASSRTIDISSILIKEIEKDSGIRQIMWLVDNGNESFDFYKVASHIPSVIIAYQTVNEKLGLKLSELPMFMTTRSTLIVTSFNSMNYFPNNTEPDDMGLLNFFTELLHANQRPKLLLIEKVQMGRNYRNILKSMWRRNFLDVTVLEVICKSRKNELISNRMEDLVLQHYWNPFKDRFTEGEFLIDGELFPEKGIDLNGYIMKVGYFHYPPYVVVTRNESGHVLKIDGPDYQLVKILSETMNFRVREIVAKKNGWDPVSCIKELNTGQTRAFMYNRINFIGVQSGKFLIPCLSKLVMFVDLSFHNIYYSPVTPTLSVDNVSISVEMKVSYLTIMIILLAVPWLFAHIIHFESSNWRMTEIFQMMLGLTSLSNPSKSSERIFLASILFTYFFFSSEIFSAFTSINLDKQPTVVIDTLDELYESIFTPVIFENVRPIFQTDILKVAKYVNRSVIIVNSDLKCVEYLIRHGNITCFMRSAVADVAISAAKKEKIAVSVHMVKEHLTDLISCLKCEPGFPHAMRFMRLVTRFQQTGIPYKWYEKYFGTETEKPTMSDAFNSESDSSNLQIYQNAIIIFAFGFGLSIVAFIGEQFMYYWNRRSK